jgi:transcriptional regulator with XRE-family HTH domain
MANSKLKDLIKAKGYTILGFAKELNISTQYVYNWINKYNPSSKYIIKICKVLNCEADDLLN